MSAAITLLRVQACCVLIGLAGCARARAVDAPNSSGQPAAPGAASESMPLDEEQREPETLAEAEQLLERARADLDRLALSEPAAPPTDAAGAPTSKASAPVAPEGLRKERAAEATSDAAPAPAPAQAAGGCEAACKAFASLERASAAVCRLDGDDGERCQRARRIREDSARRIQSCSCSK